MRSRRCNADAAEEKVDHYASMTHLLAHEREGVDYTLHLADRGAAVTVLAPHGGDIEEGTSELARAIAGESFNYYAFNGLARNGDDGQRLHVTSIRYDEPRCLALLDRSLVALALHGCGAPRAAVLFGGANQALRAVLVEEVAALGFVVGEHPRLKGTHRRNIVNRPPLQGVQVELTDRQRALLIDGGNGAARRLTAAGQALARSLRRGLRRYLKQATLPRQRQRQAAVGRLRAR